MQIKGVLVVDDDPGMRELLRDVLEMEGCNPVFDAEGGAEALSFLSEHGAQVEGMVLDLTMPGVGGEAVLKQLRTVHHGQLAVVVMSGHRTVEAIVAENQDPRLHLEHLHKPFDIADFLKKIQSVLKRMRDAQQGPA